MNACGNCGDPECAAVGGAGRMACDLPHVCNSLTVHPGSTLIVRIGYDAANVISQEQMIEFRDELQKQLPGVRVVAVCCDQLAVYEPDWPQPVVHELKD